MSVKPMGMWLITAKRRIFVITTNELVMSFQSAGGDLRGKMNNLRDNLTNVRFLFKHKPLLLHLRDPPLVLYS